MRRATSTPLPWLQPFTLWMQLGTQALEMWMSAGQVIGIRVGRMAAAGPSPNARDRREFTRMGTEKVQAATHSNLAMARQLQGSSLRLWTDAWQHWLRAAATLAPLSADAARLGLAGMAPIHKAATGNARRLSRPRRRS